MVQILPDRLGLGPSLPYIGQALAQGITGRYTNMQEQRKKDAQANVLAQLTGDKLSPAALPTTISEMLAAGMPLQEALAYLKFQSDAQAKGSQEGVAHFLQKRGLIPGQQAQQRPTESLPAMGGVLAGTLAGQTAAQDQLAPFTMVDQAAGIDTSQRIQPNGPKTLEDQIIRSMTPDDIAEALTSRNDEVKNLGKRARAYQTAKGSIETSDYQLKRLELQEANQNRVADLAERKLALQESGFNKDFVEKIYNEYDGAVADKRDLDQQKALVLSGELTSPGVAFLSGITTIPLSVLGSPKDEQFQKGVARQAQKAKEYFGSRLTDFDLRTYKESLATLLNSPEGRYVITLQAEIANDLKLKKAELLDEIITTDKKVPLDVRAKINKQMAKEEKIAHDKFMSLVKDPRVPMVDDEGRRYSIPFKELDKAKRQGLRTSL